MLTYFVDTAFWYGIVNQRDQHHEVSARWKDWIETQQVRLVTTEYVLWEFLNLCAPVPLRQLGVALYRDCHHQSTIDVIKIKRNRSHHQIVLPAV